MATATLTSKGQTTIPREIRDFLKVKAGDRLEFTLNAEDASVTLRAANIPISDIRGILKRPGMKAYRPDERLVAARKRAHR